MSSSLHKQSKTTARPATEKAADPDASFFSKEAGEPFFGEKGGAPFFQPKLKVHPAGDAYEREADAHADRITQQAYTNPPVQRMRTDEDETAQAMPLPGSISHLQAQRAFESPSAMEQNSAGGDEMSLQSKEGNGGAAAEAGDAMESSLRASKGSGSALPEDTRSQMESGLGADLSGVRVHTGSDAVQMNRNIGARAFTHGSDIYFNEGEYRPATKEGDHLLAHELTHTVQQGASKANSVQRKAGSSPSPNMVAAPPPQHTDVSSQSPEMKTMGIAGGAGEGIQRADGDDGKEKNPHDGDKGKVTRSGSTYVLEVKTIDIPKFKRNDTDASKLEIPKTERKDTQLADWESGMMAMSEVEDLAKGLAVEKNAINDKKDVFALKYKGGFLIGNKDDIKRKISRPFWDASGSYHSFHVDHIHEFQIGGPDNFSNLWLLDAKINVQSGKVLKTEKDKKIQDLVNEAAAKSNFWSKGKPEVDDIKKNNRYTIKFSALGKDLAGVKEPGKDDIYTKADIKGGKSVTPLKPLEKKDRDTLGLSDNEEKLVLFLGPQGGSPHVFKMEKGKLKGNTINIGNFAINPAKSNISFDSNNVVQNGSSISIQIFKDNKNITKYLDIKKGDLDVNVYSMQGLPHIGTLRSSEWSPKFKELIEAAGLSPIDFQQIDIDDKKGLVIRGKILPSIPIIANADISFVLEGNDLYLEKTFTADEFKVPAPFKITGASLTIKAGTIGLEFSGGVQFEINKVGEGSIRAFLGTQKKFSVEGEFNFDKKLFDNANVKVKYVDQKWAVEGTINIPPKKVKGIKKASATIAYSEGTLAASGTVEPDIKGVKQGSFELKYSEEQFLISGKLQLSNDIPRLKKGELNVTLESNAGEGYKVKGSGVAEFDFPGINTGLTVQYDDGALTIEATVHFEKGMAKGDIKAGATNRPIDAQGNPSGEPGSKWTIYGGGSLTIQITPWLAATAGVQFLPNGELKVLGRIELPSTVDVFSQKSFEKTLFEMPTIEIPIFAIPLGPKSLGLVAQIRGGLDFKASIGPGQLRGLYGQIEYNPSHPEETTLSGGGTFAIPAEASLNLHASLGLGLSVGIASLTGGIELVAGVGLKGEASAGINVSWNPTSGLELNAEGKIMVQPKFKFDVNLFARASLDLWITSISKEWRYNLASFEYGPGFEFGLIFPVHYKEGQPFNISFDDVQVIKPDVDILGTAKGIAGKIKDAVFGDDDD
ncbi:MAG TPA: DUF4157 domain-containing protein [Puia sp.]|nr:DUF4157 domain-containing protein [Puia sp.]